VRLTDNDLEQIYPDSRLVDDLKEARSHQATIDRQRDVLQRIANKAAEGLRRSHGHHCPGRLALQSIRDRAREALK